MAGYTEARRSGWLIMFYLNSQALLLLILCGKVGSVSLGSVRSLWGYGFDEKGFDYGYFEDSTMFRLSLRYWRFYAIMVDLRLEACTFTFTHSMGIGFDLHTRWE